MATHTVLEHRERGIARWVRTRRFRLAFGIALVETLLIALDLLQWRWALLIAAVVLAFHVFKGRKASSRPLRQLSLAAALSQSVPLVIPFVVAAVAGVALVILAVFVGIVLALLVFDRRR